MQLFPATLQGSIAAIPSKSVAHRLFIAASLSDTPSCWHLPTSSVDIDTTLACLAALGAQIEKKGDWIHIAPIEQSTTSATLNCQESGSTLRFLLPVAAALKGAYQFIGCGRLPERPIDDFLNTLEHLGATTSHPRLPLTIQGPLYGKEVHLTGHISSQYLTGLLLAAPLLDEGLHIHLTTPLQSRPYVDITLGVLKQFGITVEEDGTDFHVLPHQQYQCPIHKGTIEGDWSNAAFFLAAGAISHAVTVTGLNTKSAQGDAAIQKILEDFGAEISIQGDAITVAPAPLKGQIISVKEIPDLLPILAVVAANAEGETLFTDVERLRLKESDRLVTTSQLLQAIGVECQVDAHTMRVQGGRPFHVKGSVDSANDHRIVMATAIAALNTDGPLTLTGTQAVTKSYPHFFEDYQQLGGICHGI